MEAALETGAATIPVPLKRLLPLGPFSIGAHLCQVSRERLVALEASVSHFGRQTESQEEVLASHMDAKGAARAQGLAEFQET